METCRRCYSQYIINWQVTDQFWKKLNKYCRSTIHEQEYSHLCIDCFLKVCNEGKLGLSKEDFILFDLHIINGVLINLIQTEDNHGTTMETRRHPALRRKKF